MDNPNTKDTFKAERDAVISQVIDSWKLQNRKLSGLVNKLSEDELLTEVTPGRNRALYLLGHLVASNDMMFSMLGIGRRLYPELEELFVWCPDRTLSTYPAAFELKAYWFKLIDLLIQQINLLTVEDWLTTPVHEPAINLQEYPVYNKLNLLITSAHHQSYHIGQLNLML